MCNFVHLNWIVDYCGMTLVFKLQFVGGGVCRFKKNKLSIIQWNERRTHVHSKFNYLRAHIASSIATHANQSLILIVSLIGNLVLVRVTGKMEKKKRRIEVNHSTNFLIHSFGHFTDNEFLLSNYTTIFAIHCFKRQIVIVTFSHQNIGQSPKYRPKHWIWQAIFIFCLPSITS